MKLINKYANSRYSKMNEYYYEITTELDKLAGLDPNSPGSDEGKRAEL